MASHAGAGDFHCSLRLANLVQPCWFICKKMVPEVGVEPTWAQGPLDFESSASTSFTTPARDVKVPLVILQHPFCCQEESAFPSVVEPFSSQFMKILF